MCQTSPPLLLMPRIFFKNCLSLHRSKSTSDIQVDPNIIRQTRYEELQKYREQIKDSEDKWQDVSIYTYCALTLQDICLLPVILVIQIKTSKMAEISFVPHTEVKGERMIYGICAAVGRAGVVVQSVATG